MGELNWYGVRTIYSHADRRSGQDHLYEERIVLVRAPTADEAIAKAEGEARTYATDGVEYLEYAMAFAMFDEPGEMAEVFSLMRFSRMQTEEYIDRFFDTGRERSQYWPPTLPVEGRG